MESSRRALVQARLASLEIPQCQYSSKGELLRNVNKLLSGENSMQLAQSEIEVHAPGISLDPFCREIQLAFGY